MKTTIIIFAAAVAGLLALSPVAASAHGYNNNYHNGARVTAYAPQVLVVVNHRHYDSFGRVWRPVNMSYRQYARWQARTNDCLWPGHQHHGHGGWNHGGWHH